MIKISNAWYALISQTHTHIYMYTKLSCRCHIVPRSEDKLQCSSLLLKKRRAPSKTFKYALAAGC